MRFRSRSFRYSTLAVTAALTLPTVRPILAQNAAQPPRTALVSAVRGAVITLGIGSDDGAVRGAVYGIAREGRVRARLQILEARAADSTAAILEAEPNFVVSVGDTAQFIAVQDVTVVAPPTIPVTPEIPVPTTPEIPAPEIPTTPTTPAVPTTPIVTPVASASTTALITAVEGEQVTLNIGALGGVRTGAKVPITRNGDVVAIVRLRVVTDDSSVGDIVWRDEGSGPISIGDAATLLSGMSGATISNPNDSSGTAPVITIGETPTQPIPRAPMLYETGASNAVVPRSEETYDYLAALAASKLITRYPAHLFHDEGAREHQTSEDITFSRAQIADLIREAITNAQARGDDELSGKQSTALGALVEEYESDLQKLGVAQSTLDALQQGRKNFEIAYSGQSRASLILGSARNGGLVGNGRDFLEPFSEPRGGQRTRSGFDSRNNIFGHIGENLRFFAQVESGTDTRRGGDDGGFEISQAFVDYNANKLLRGLNLKVGRDTVWWGPGHFGTLLLGDLAGPLNAVQSTFKRGSYQLDGLYAPLDRGPLGGRRSLYGHNLQVKIGPQARIGFAETLLLPQDRIDPIAFLSTFSPIPLFAIERARNRNTAADNGNSLVQAYIEASLARGIRSWGEVLVDDIGVNANNLVRNRIGALVGFHAFTPRDPAKLGFFAEYANLGGRTYLGLQALSDGDYFYRGAPLGYPVAPPQGTGAGGAESLRFEGYWRAIPRLRLSAGVEFADIAAEQSNSSRQQVYRFRAAYDLSRTITLVARARRVSTDRPNFTAGVPSITRNLLQFEVARAF